MVRSNSGPANGSVGENWLLRPDGTTGRIRNFGRNVDTAKRDGDTWILNGQNAEAVWKKSDELVGEPF